MSRQGLINYENKDEFFDTIKRAKQKVEQYNEELLLSGKNVAGVIFNLKNNWGWKDKQDIEVDNKNGQDEFVLRCNSLINKRIEGLLS